LTRKLTTKEFVTKAKDVHGETYGYELSHYVSTHVKVKIVCKAHGVFEMSPAHHLSGQGCGLCAIEKTASDQKLSVQQFIERAQALHGKNAYDYSFVQYTNNQTKVVIICKDHGQFNQTPACHLSGQGCPICAVSRNGLALSRKAGLVFEEKALARHGDLYDYTLVEYRLSKTPVKIICKDHGPFLQTPSDHLGGKGCPSCAKTGFQPDRPAVLYVFNITSPLVQFTGFGITKNYKQRLQQHTCTLTKHSASIDKMFSTHFDTGAQAAKVETLLQQTFPLCLEASNIEGFKTESTTATFSEVVAFVEKIKGEMDNGCTRPDPSG
jgi:hypothetical protein